MRLLPLVPRPAEPIGETILSLRPLPECRRLSREFHEPVFAFLAFYPMLHSPERFQLASFLDGDTTMRSSRA